MISPYLILFFLLFFLSFLCEMSKELERISFPILVLILFFFLAFRYGQGTDFFGYYVHFSSIKTFSDAIENPLHIHSEVGMRLLYWLFNDYLTMNFFVAAFSMMMLFIALRKFQFNRVFSLLIFFPTCYLTYFFSGIRQGIALAIFLGVLLNYLIEGKYKHYFVFVGIAVCFHLSSIIFLIIPFWLKFDLEQIKKMMIYSIILGILILLFCLGGFFPIIYRFNFSLSGITILSYLERIISLFIILKLADLNHDYDKQDMFLQTLLKLYLLGTCIYFTFGVLNSVSRISIYFKALECILVPYLIWKSDKKTNIYAYIFSLIVIVMTIKNIGSYISQGMYYPGVTIWNYPYVTVFDSYDEIYMYRPVDFTLHD